ncbi:MAG: hypothetical protein AAFW87_03130 [Pseudomonadota bacterium]
MRVATQCLVFGFALVLAFATVGTISIAQYDNGVALRNAPEDGGPRRWQVVGELTVTDRPSIDADVIGILPDGAIVSNRGCKTIAGQTWCEIRPLRERMQGFAQAKLLRPAQGPDGVVPLGLDDSKRRARARDFDSRGKIPCAQVQGQVMGICNAATALGGGGDATVVVTFANGFARELYFVHGEFMRANATMSGVGTDLDWRLENGTYFIRVDDQRFELPESLAWTD